MATAASMPNPFDTSEPSASQDASKASSNLEVDEKPTIERFSPEEEAALLQESNKEKTSANKLFAQGAYEEAIPVYSRALASCPSYLEYENAVLHSNVAACYLKLSDWDNAVKSASDSLECLERLDPVPKPKPKPDVKEGENGTVEGVEEVNGSGSGVVEEVDDEGEARIEALAKSGRTLDEIRKLRAKALMRRAKARSEIGSWAALQGAQEDYQAVLSLPIALTPMDKKIVTRALYTDLPPQLKETQQRETAEMMSKLKGLGNSLLKPFGFSTDNFQFVKDEQSGGYSMNFNQNPGK